jgi:hypothetical protein
MKILVVQLIECNIGLKIEMQPNYFKRYQFLSEGTEKTGFRRYFRNL